MNSCLVQAAEEYLVRKAFDAGLRTVAKEAVSGWENGFPVRQCVTQGENDLAFGFHAADLAAFYSLDCGGGHSRQTGQFHFAYQAIFPDFPEVVPVLHDTCLSQKGNFWI